MIGFIIYTLGVLFAGEIIRPLFVAVGRAIRSSFRRRPRPTIPLAYAVQRFERNPLDIPSVWRQRVSRELVFGKRVIEADATEIR